MIDGLRTCQIAYLRIDKLDKAKATGLIRQAVANQSDVVHAFELGKRDVELLTYSDGKTRAQR